MNKDQHSYQMVHVVKTDFHANFDSPIYIYSDLDSALKQFSKLIRENYTFEQLLDPTKVIYLDSEEGIFKFDTEGSPDQIYIEEMTVNP